jgi:hypothetical protein
MMKTYFLAFGLIAQLWMGLSGLEQNQNQVQDKQVAYRSSPVIKNEMPKIVTAPGSDVNYDKKFEEMGITLHPGTDFAPDSLDDPISADRCASLVYRTLEVLPKETVSNLKNLTLYFNNTGRRGLGGGSTIILRCENVTDAELVSVLVHEMGHIEDTGVLKGNFWAGESEFRDGKNPIYNDDVSLDFYRISFKNDKTIMAKTSDLDFVSGYAKTDPFEDFAETYNYYLLQGNNFRILAGNNDALMKKYDFMREKVFNGREFDFQGVADSGLLTTRSYDSTMLGYNLKNFLAI